MARVPLVAGRESASRGRAATLLACSVLVLASVVVVRGGCKTCWPRRMLAETAMWAAPATQGPLGRATAQGGAVAAQNSGAGSPGATERSTERGTTGVADASVQLHARCSLLLTLRFRDNTARDLFAADAGFARQQLPGGGCSDDPDMWVQLARSDDWWSAHPHGWVDARCPAALYAEPDASASAVSGAVPGTSTALPLTAGPLLQALRALRAESDRRGCAFVAFTTIQEPALEVAATHARVVVGAAWAGRAPSASQLQEWAHNHPELLLVERLWRVHLPAGDGPGSEDELAPRGDWAKRARAGGVTAPPPSAREGLPQDAAGSTSLLALGMEQDLKDLEKWNYAKHQLLPDWRCEPDGDMDMLRVCGHMDDLFPRLQALVYVIEARRDKAGSDERFQATCSLKACGELAPLVAVEIPASSAPPDVACCALRQQAVQLLQDSFASSRGAYLRFKRGAHGCDVMQRNASAALAEFDIVAPESRVFDAVLLASLALGTPEARAPGLLAEAAVASNLAAAEAAAAAARAALPEEDRRALASFNICSNVVYEDVKSRFEAMMEMVSGDFAELAATANAFWLERQRAVMGGVKPRRHTQAITRARGRKY